MKLLLLLPRFRQAQRELAVLAERETWPREDIEQFQLERLNAVWRHARQYVPYYRHLAADHALPPTFQSLTEYSETVPTLGKSTVLADPQAFFSERHSPGRWHRTGGSTGTPMSVYWGTAASREALRARYRYYEMWGVDFLDRCAFLWGHSASFAAGWSGRIERLRMPCEDWLRNRIRLSAYQMGEQDLQQHLKRIHKFQPRSIYGYSQSLYLLAMQAESQNVKIDSLQMLTLTGEPAMPLSVETIERVFDAPATVEYGSTEFGIIASEWPDRSLRVREDIVQVETPRNPSGCHDIVVSTLNNFSFPLLRYDIGDATSDPIARPQRGFATLQDVLGRNNDFIVTRDGNLLHSARLDALFKKDTTAIRRFRVHQHQEGTVEVSLELKEGQPFDAIEMQQKLEQLTAGYPVHLELTAEIQQTVAGKHRLVVSDLFTTKHGTAAVETAGPKNSSSAQTPKYTPV